MHAGFNFEGDKSTWITPENVASRAALFASFARQKSAGYATPSLMVPFGSDFQFTNATINYENMDALMEYMNNNTDLFGMKLHYSTPTEYMETLHAMNRSWSVL